MSAEARRIPGWAVHPGADGETRLINRRIYIVPTRAGLTFALALLVMLLGSLNYGSNVGLGFTFLFGGVALVGMLYTWRNLLDLRIQASSASPVFAGQPASFPVQLGEQQGLDRAAILVTARRWKASAPAVDLPALSQVHIDVNPIPQQRGEHPLGNLEILTRFPLGLFRAWAYVETTATVLAYPAPARGASPRPTIRFVPSAQGDRGVGVDDFIGLRPYRRGDPLRSLDWKALARERGLVTRQFGGDRSEEIWLEWDAAGPGDREERLSRLCRMVLDAAALDRHYGLRLPGVSLAPAAGDVHKHRCLTQLALFPVDAGSESKALADRA